MCCQVVAEDTNDEWSIHRPRELKPGSFGPAIYKELTGRGEPIKEKNWMPFVYDGQLHMAHSVVPHRVFRWAGDTQLIGWRRWRFQLERGGSHMSYTGKQWQCGWQDGRSSKDSRVFCCTRYLRLRPQRSHLVAVPLCVTHTSS